MPNKLGKAHFKVLFWRKWQQQGPARTLGTLALAIVKVSGKALARAGKRAFDFRQPALPGLPPGPGQDFPALPSGRNQNKPVMNEAEKLIRKSSDWRKHPIWNWLSGGESVRQ
ncbi:hypothetical protein ACSYAY_06480 [Leptospirillum ferriphilum]|uniref:hypothetical protein n=1 Tax=Leptospirillum ferriphilum TaxID=178606 RepID=UPI003EE53B4A